MKNHQLLAFGAWALALALAPNLAQAGKPRPGARPSELFGKPDGKADPGAKDEHGKGEHGKDEHGHEGFRSAMRELREQLKAGTLKKADLKAQLAKLHETSAERSKEHRQELGKRWGAALAQPAAREELKKHAHRMALLDRAMLLCQTEVTKDKDKVTERVTKLIDKENERHEHAMESLKSAAAAAAASAVPAAAAPAASTGTDTQGAAK